MDLNALLNTMLSGESLESISRMSGSSQAEVKSVLSAALPSLLGGALEQSQNEATADGFAKALTDHAQVDTRDLGQFVSNVDMIDGGKILTHLLGGNATSTAQDVATRSGMDLGQTIKILALVAPLLMSLLGQQTQQSQPQSALSGNLVGTLMANMLGGGNSNSSAGLGLLGSLLGGSNSTPANNGGGLLGNLLGGALGGGDTTSANNGGGLLGSLLSGANTTSANNGGLLGSLLGGANTTSANNGGMGLLGSLLGATPSAAAAPAETTATTGKKKKKKPAMTGEAIPLTQSAQQAQPQTTQQSEGPGLMDILMGLLK